MLHCEAEQHADEVVVTTQHVLEYRGNALFLSRKTRRVDDRGVLHGDIQVDIASDIPEPARVGLSVHLAETPENVSWLGLGPHENYPDRKLAAQQGRWTLPRRRCIRRISSRRKMVCAVIRGSWRWERIS